MVRIEAITPESAPEVLVQARALFRSYGEFLRNSGGHALFCFSRLEEEIASLPAAYTEKGGEVLLGMDGTQAAGCIAYRSMACSDPACCEIKRLFVGSAYRGQGLGKSLVLAALERARQNGFRTACLDTEPNSMRIAKEIYFDLGFVMDDERNSQSEDSLVTYLRKAL